MTILQLIILALATWRISSLITDEGGPFQIFERWRNFATNYTGLFDCIWCFSVWMGTLITIAYFIWPYYTFWLSVPFALSAIAIALEKKIYD